MKEAWPAFVWNKADWEFDPRLQNDSLFSPHFARPFCSPSSLNTKTPCRDKLRHASAGPFLAALQLQTRIALQENSSPVAQPVQIQSAQALLTSLAIHGRFVSFLWFMHVHLTTDRQGSVPFKSHCLHRVGAVRLHRGHRFVCRRPRPALLQDKPSRPGRVSGRHRGCYHPRR